MKTLMVGLAVILAIYGGLTEAKLEQITEENWRETLDGEWMVEFFAPWCPACRSLGPAWEEFSGWSNDLEIRVAQVDVTTSPGLSGRFMVTALPTIFHVKDGIFRQYRGARDKDSFITFIEDKKWSSIEPVSDWKSPDSFQMTMVSHFFKLSMVLRNIHSTLTEDYQLPAWASYVTFALVTIALGGILGLVLVCCIDCIYPPRREERVQPAQSNRTDKKDSDVEEEDDIDESEVSDDGGDMSQEDEGDRSQAGSQEEEEEDEGERSQQDEEEDRAEDNQAKSRRRKPRKAD